MEYFLNTVSLVPVIGEHSTLVESKESDDYLKFKHIDHLEITYNQGRRFSKKNENLALSNTLTATEFIENDKKIFFREMRYIDYCWHTFFFQLRFNENR